MKKLTISRPILYVFIIAILLRIAMPSLHYYLYSYNNDQIFAERDTWSYYTPAQSLIDRFEFSRNIDEPEIIRTPGYPIFMIPGLLLGHLPEVTVFLQVILSCLTVFVIYKISWELFQDEQAAFFTTLVTAFDRTLIFYTYMLMAETLSTFIISLFLYYVILYFKNNKLRDIVISAILLVMVIYVKPAGYYLPVFLILSLTFYLFIKKELTKKLLIHLLIFLIISVSLISMWQIRNYMTTGYKNFAAISDVNIYFNHAAMVISEKEGIGFTKIQKRLGFNTFNLNEKVDIIGSVMENDNKLFSNRAQAYEYIRGKGIKIILSDPILYAKIHLKGMLNILKAVWIPRSLYNWVNEMSGNHYGIVGLLKNAGLVKTLYIVACNPIMLSTYFLFMGVIFLYICVFITIFDIGGDISKSSKIGIFILFIIAVYYVTIAGVPGNERMRHPIIPSISVLGGMGMSIAIRYIIERWKTYKTKQYAN